MPYNKDTHKPLQLYPTKELYAELEKEAKEQDRSVKYIAEKIIKEYMENKTKST